MQFYVTKTFDKLSVNIDHVKYDKLFVCLSLFLTPRHMQSRYLPTSNSFICGASHREAVSTILKVFGMTRPWVGENPRPPEL